MKPEITQVAHDKACTRMVVELMCRFRATVFNDGRRLLETQLRYISSRYSDFMYNSGPTACSPY